jgi:MFS family permease
MRTPVTRKPVRILVVLTLCLGLQMTGYLMILPLFARRFERFGAGVEALGLSAMVYALTGTIAAPFLGMLADRFGRRHIILVSLAAHVVTFGGYLLATIAWLLVLLRGLASVLTAGLVPAISSTVGNVAVALLEVVGEANAHVVSFLFDPHSFRAVQTVRGNLKGEFIDGRLQILRHVPYPSVRVGALLCQ